MFKNLAYQIFASMQKFGIDVLPRHFYSEIPCINDLKKTKWWRKPYDFTKLKITTIEEQITNLHGIFKNLNKIESEKIHLSAIKNNKFAGYGQIESGLLYYFAKKTKPKKIVQIGCGVSTAVLINAIGHIDCEIVCIEPFPNQFLLDLSNNKKIKLLTNKVQELDNLNVILNDCDLFFVDSTHALGPSGEVSRIILEYLPLLKSGAIIHFHDIYFPFDYQSEILTSNLFFQHESVLLQSFLAFNIEFKLIFSASMIFHFNNNVFHTIFSDFNPRLMVDGLKQQDGQFPSCCYIQKM